MFYAPSAVSRSRLPCHSDLAPAAPPPCFFFYFTANVDLPEHLGQPGQQVKLEHLGQQVLPEEQVESGHGDHNNIGQLVQPEEVEVIDIDDDLPGHGEHLGQTFVCIFICLFFSFLFFLHFNSLKSCFFFLFTSQLLMLISMMITMAYCKGVSGFT